MWMCNKIWIVGYGGSYKYKFEEIVEKVFKPDEIEKYIKTPTSYKCYLKNGDYLYGSNFDAKNNIGLRFDTIFIDKYIYWNLLTDEDRNQLLFIVPSSRDIIIV